MTIPGVVGPVMVGPTTVDATMVGAGHIRGLFTDDTTSVDTGFT